MNKTTLRGTGHDFRKEQPAPERYRGNDYRVSNWNDRGLPPPRRGSTGRILTAAMSDCGGHRHHYVYSGERRPFINVAPMLRGRIGSRQTLSPQERDYRR